MTTPGPAVLDLERINTFRGAAHVLRDVSLRVGAAETVCLVGRNGAGKTTTLESAMGLLPVRAGRVTFQGRDVTRLPAHQRARLGIGFAPEDAGVFPDLTVAENLELGHWLAGSAAGARNDSHARMFAFLPEIEAFTTRRGLNLSGGQKRMVAIALMVMVATYSPSMNSMYGLEPYSTM